MPSMGRLLVIGGGVMGRAIVEGGLRARILSPDELIIAEPDQERRAAFNRLGVATHESPQHAIRAALELESRHPDRPAHTILLAVKPQVFAQISPAISVSLVGARPRPLISIMAGIRTAAINAALHAPLRIIRAMPNTPARVGAGVTGVAPSPAATPDDLDAARTLFAALGPLVVTIDEDLIDAFTAVAGSGPAYLFFLAEAMQHAAVELGFDPRTAADVVAQTLRGAAALLDGTDPADLRAAVTSKGGTTAAAIASMQADNLHDAIVRALTAARDRARQLAS